MNWISTLYESGLMLLVVFSFIAILLFLIHHRSWIFHPTTHRVWILTLVCGAAFIDDIAYVTTKHIASFFQ